MRIAITDATYKHALALAYYLKRFDSKLELTGINPVMPRGVYFYKKRYQNILAGTLEEILKKHSFDLVIPVGNSSVETLTRIGYQNAILPPVSSLSIALSKLDTMRFAKNLDIPVPKTYSPLNLKECEALEPDFPYVVKGTLEAGKNLVHYVRNPDALKIAFKSILNDPSQKGTPPIVQEYVRGVGLGFFAYYQNGELVRFYMHRRLREYPVSGGSATAAETFFHKAAFLDSKKLLDALRWNGPCMVEYKYDQITGKHTLIEINPKLWGSLELGLRAGLNFGEYLINSIKKETLIPCLHPVYPPLKFYWPFDGDLAGIYEQKNLAALADYAKWGYSTNKKSLGSALGFLRLASKFFGKKL